MGMIDVRRRMIASQPHRATAQGAIASFSTDMKAKLKMSFDILPIQDLHGQDAPYPAGGGKNRFDNSTVTTGKYFDGSGVIQSTENGSISDYIPVKAETTYRINQYFTTNVNRYAVYYDSNKTKLDVFKPTYTGGTFTTPASCEYIRISTHTALNDSVMITEGSDSQGEYAPYSNICPISGHTGFTRNRTGKNHIKVTAENLERPSYYSSTWTGTSVAEGENAITVTRGTGSGGFGGIVIPEGLPAGKWRFSCTVPATINNKVFYYGYLSMEGVYSGQSNAISFNASNTNPSFTLTLNKPVKSIFFKMSSQNASVPLTFSNLMLERGDTATEYEAPSIVSKATTFPTPPGTVYGGHVTDNGDGTGTIIVEWKGKYLSDLQWTNNGSYANIFNGTGFTDRKKKIDGTDGKAYCDTYAFYTSGDIMNYETGIALANTNTSTTIYVKDTAYENAAAFAASLAENDVLVVCKLETPVEYTLSLDAIQSLIGQNHIWVDNADSVNVEYWGH